MVHRRGTKLAGCRFDQSEARTALTQAVQQAACAIHFSQPIAQDGYCEPAALRRRGLY